MRNFFPSSSPAIFDKMFGKGARQIQADPSTNLVGCCCNCKSVACKGCISGHVISPDAGCCHGRNNGLIFEYERPEFKPRGSQCSNTCNDTAVCCNAGKAGASNVRFYYNYIGQYFRIDFSAKDDKAKLCSYCDPTSSDINRRFNGFPFGEETCLDHVLSNPDIRIYKDIGPPTQDFGDYPCSNNDQNGPIVNEISLFKGCQCMGNGLLKDPSDKIKRVSKYRKRQMERNPYYRWLLDIICYDNGNIISSPFYEYSIEKPDFTPQKRTRTIGGTLFDHLIGTVHCEHWYEIARCDENPEHGDGNLLGNWIVDANGNPIGANTSFLAPRFWIYACSGAPLFDFDLERAYEAKDPTNANRPLLDPDEIQKITRNLANKETPRGAIMDKLASLGLFDVGDWRPEALSEIRILKGLTYTKEAYGGNFSGPPDQGACCIAERIEILPDGSEITIPASCTHSSEDDCRVIYRGDFYARSTCTSDLCSNCSGFKPGIGQAKYLGPVRKKLWIPQEDGGINWNGVTGPAWLNPKKARKNTRDSLLPTPSLAKLEINVDNDDTLTNLQLPDDLIKDPWGGSYPPEPIGAEEPSDEWKDFVTWRESQWLYMHAKPGGWDYVCPGYGVQPEEGDPVFEEQRIPNLPRRVSTTGRAYGGCLDGVLGFPRQNILVQSGCYDIFCGDPNNPSPSPQVGCGNPCANDPLPGLDCETQFECPYHTEHGGGMPPCRGVAFDSNCDGIRWLFYSQSTVPGNLSTGTPSYLTCDTDALVNSYLYRVNLDVGNFSEFCPHRCRPLEIPNRIANGIPRIFSNRSAHRSICENRRANSLDPQNFPQLGDMCPGLFCRAYPFPSSPDLPYNALFRDEQTACCGPKLESSQVVSPTPQNSSHDASNKIDCPLYPGPPCLVPECIFYDERFTGQYLDFDPEGCCWTCTVATTGVPSQPIEYKGFISYTACKAENEKISPNSVWEGKGFLYVPDEITNPSACSGITVGNCACGTLGGVWVFGGKNCNPEESQP